MKKAYYFLIIGFLFYSPIGLFATVTGPVHDSNQEQAAACYATNSRGDDRNTNLSRYVPIIMGERIERKRRSRSQPPRSRSRGRSSGTGTGRAVQ